MLREVFFLVASKIETVFVVLDCITNGVAKVTPFSDGVHKIRHHNCR